MLPALEATLEGLGIDLRAQENIHLDVEERPLKTPRAFCSPIEVPERVMLVIKPMGGPDDWHALFHEAGHAEHFAHTSGSLPMEARRLGDNAVTEGWAMLLEYLVDDPAWHARRLDMPRADEFAAEGATILLYIVRRYCAKLLYELELHALEDVTAARARYTELLGRRGAHRADGRELPGRRRSGFYATCYLRAWAFEAQLRGYLRERFGTDWFTQARGRVAPARAVVGRPGHTTRRRAARRGRRHGDRAGGDRRPRTRLCPSCLAAYSSFMTRTRVLIVGAAGRDFHNFNLVYRGREQYEVVAFTATQIPNIDGRAVPGGARRRPLSRRASRSGRRASSSSSSPTGSTRSSSPTRT